VVLLDFHLFRFELLIAGRHVARGRFTLFPRLRAFECYYLTCHKIILKTGLSSEGFYSFSRAGFSSGSSSSSTTSTPPVLSTVPSVPSLRERNAPSRSSWACASTVKRVHGIASRRALGMLFPVSSQVP